MTIEKGDIVFALSDPTGALALVLTMPYVKEHHPDDTFGVEVVDVLWTDDDYIMTCYVSALQIKMKRA